MKHLYYLFIFLFFNISQSIIAENVITDPKEDWDKSNERTITSTPQLSIDDSFLYIYSEEHLDNVSICIQDNNGNIIYSIVTTIPCCQTYSIPVSNLNNGEYSLLLTIDNKYLLATISIDN